MNRLARGVSSISSKCSSSGASFPFCLSVSYSHAIYNYFFTQLVHPAHLSLQGKTVTVLRRCCSAGQTCTEWCIRKERLSGLSCQMMLESQADTKTCTGDDECFWYTSKNESACCVWWGKTQRQEQRASKSSMGASRALHCLLVYMMLRHLATVADQINLLIWQQGQRTFISWEFGILTGGGQECHF